MATVAFITLGCKVNQFETEVMEGLFKKAGYAIVPHTEKADVYVINTCSVTSTGDKKSRQMIRKTSRLNPDAVIAVTGCYSQIAPEEIKAIEGVNIVLGTNKRNHIVDLVEQVMARNNSTSTGSGEIIDGVDNIMKVREFEDIPMYEMPTRTRAFLKIEEGCTNFCSYCIIPYTRGPVRSRHLSTVRSEAEKLIANGFKEIVFTGIHLGAYGRDLPETNDGRKINLADAARAVLDLPGLRRLRLGSLESIELSPELLELLHKHPRFSHHLHLPLQAGSDYVLKRMNRHYNREEFRQLLVNIRKAVPRVAISTDIIVGFPGETKEMFEDSLGFIKELGFCRIHVFPYSRRTGTPAAEMPDQVPENIKKERVQKLQRLADAMAESYQLEYLDTVQDVLFETNTAGITDGLTDTYIRVYTDEEVQTGEIYSMRLVKLYRDGIWAVKA